MPVLRQTVRLHRIQQAFRKSDALFRGFVGGRGAGKSWVGAYDLLRRAKPGCFYLVGAPTYPMLRDASWRSLLALAVELRFLKKCNQTEPSLLLGNGAQIIGRSAENPERFRGPNLSGIWLDEASQAEQAAFDIGVACLREGGVMGWFSATFTPRGKQHWTYETFGRRDARGNPLRPNTALFQARTKDNPFLPVEFYTTVQQQYTSALAAQELEGEFTDLEGALFRRHWFALDDAAPAALQTVRYWDLASTEPKKPGDDPDWTAGVLMQRSREGVYHVLDIRRVRRTPAKVEALVRQTAEEDGRTTAICMEQEPGSSGVHTIDRYRRQVLAGWNFRGIRPTGGKSERARPLSAMAEAGHVHLLRGAWNKDFLDEIEVFPLGKHDDQVDGAAGAFQELTGKEIVSALTLTPAPAPRPLLPPPAPRLDRLTLGNLPARTLYVQLTYLHAGGETAGSPEASIQLGAGQVLVLASPPAPAHGTAAGYHVYAGGAPGALRLQNDRPLPFGSSWTEPETGLGMTGRPLGLALGDIFWPSGRADPW